MWRVCVCVFYITPLTCIAHIRKVHKRTFKNTCGDGGGIGFVPYWGMPVEKHMLENAVSRQIIEVVRYLEHADCMYYACNQETHTHTLTKLLTNVGHIWGGKYATNCNDVRRCCWIGRMCVCTWDEHTFSERFNDMRMHFIQCHWLCEIVECIYLVCVIAQVKFELE